MTATTNKTTIYMAQ